MLIKLILEQWYYGQFYFSIILFCEGNSLDYHEVSLISSLSLRGQLEEAWADA